jgi:hypothetical protein
VLLDGVGPVVALSPSGIPGSGIGPGGPVESPAWTFRGDGIPFARTTTAPPELLRPPGPDAPPLALRPIFETALADPTLWRHAEIAVECAKGPMLLVSGEDDAMWPGKTMANMIERRAADRACGIGSCICTTPVRVTRASACPPTSYGARSKMVCSQSRIVLKL